jgi:hypothetical protein
VTAFLLLHELTAVVPLFGLTALFHYTNWLPPFFSEGAWIKAGIERFARYSRRKGWIQSDEEAELELDVKQDAGEAGDGANQRRAAWWAKYWERNEGRMKLVIEYVLLVSCDLTSSA